MLPKNRRIARKDFPYILSNVKRLSSPFLFLNIAKIEKEKNSQFSFSVSKKVSKSAVKRNKLRRRGYSVIEKNIKNIKPGFFLLFNYKKGAETQKFSILEKEILELLRKSFVLE